MEKVRHHICVTTYHAACGERDTQSAAWPSLAAASSIQDLEGYLIKCTDDVGRESVVTEIDCVMPVGPGEQPWAGEAIESMITQRGVTCHVVCVLDQRLELPVSAQHLEGSSQVAVVCNEGRSGIVGALNTGIAHSSTDLIARMDADDVSHPDRLAVQLDALDRSMNLLATELATENTAGWRAKEYPVDVGVDRVRRVPPYRLMLSNPIPHGSALMRRSVVLDAGGYRVGTDGVEDYDLWLRMARCGDLGIVRLPLLWRREHGDQVTASSRSWGTYAALHGTKRQLAATALRNPTAGSVAHSLYLGRQAYLSALLRIRRWWPTTGG